MPHFPTVKIYVIMKHLCFLILFLVISAKYAPAAVTPLSPQAQLSLLTSSPTDDAVYTLYGHSAIRVCDPETKTDVVFNYGIFDFSRPNFIYRFAKGETDYMVRAYDFNYYLMEYIERGSEICEQILNLLPQEKESLWQALVRNELPENRTYRYNFFFDNCATRPAAMIENHIHGPIRYPPQSQPDTSPATTLPAGQPSFREAINFLTRHHPWITFGCDLVLGAPTDRVMTLRERFFLPEYLKNTFDKATIERYGTIQPLVIKTIVLSEETSATTTPSPVLATPMACFTLVLLILLGLTWAEGRKKTYYRWLDILLFFPCGMAGCILFFLSFVSVHPATFPNISLLWLHPFHLAGTVFFSVKKFNKPAFWYHFINFATILGMSIAWIFVTQHFNIAFMPLIASLWLRSAVTLIRKKQSVG